MGSYILAIDQGTTSSRAIIVDRCLNIKGAGQKEFPQIFPKPGWVEHNAATIWATVESSIAAALKNAAVRPGEIAGIGITNQRETIVLWDPRTGEPLHNAVVWQCRRSAAICEKLKKKGLTAKFTARTGLLLDPYFSGTKLAWLFENIPSLRNKAKNGNLKAGTIDSYLVFRLTGGASHVTDASNASRTLLFDINKLSWDPELAGLLGVPLSILPEVRGNSEIYGRTKGLKCLPDGIPISGMAGDQQAALFGQACFNKGDVKCTYGTGSFILMNTGDKAVSSRNRLLTTIAWQLKGKTVYALEGSAFMAGASVQWLRDGLKLIKHSCDVEDLAGQVKSSEGVVLVPAFAGLGAPHWRSGARGLISGMTRGTTAAHIARATLEAIALQNYDLIKAMEADSGLRLNQLRVDGGACVNDLLMQIQADIMNKEIVRPRLVETTAIGAAFLAGLGVGYWPDLKEISRTWKKDRQFSGKMEKKLRQELINNWQLAVQKA
ncbi:MAG: glycerol kinase GlpK [Elusimicrobiales bacterium]